MKNLSIIILFALALGVSATFAEAQCTPIYGGGQSCAAGNLVVDKKVANPQTGTFVENLFESDPKYGPDSLVTFQVNVTNTGSTAFSNVVVKDVFPPYTRFEGTGSYVDSTRTLTYTIPTLNPGQTHSQTITARVAGADQLPQNRMCGDDSDVNRRIINQAIASVNSITVQDLAKFCIEKAVAIGGPVVPGKGQPTTVTKGGLKVFPAPMVTKTPPTGPEMLALAALLPTGLLGQFLRKRSVK
jgi:uncharacterized repeat protein (TIGR01451 family)